MAEDIKMIFEKYKEVLKEAFNTPEDLRSKLYRSHVHNSDPEKKGSGGRRIGGGSEDTSLAGKGFGKTPMLSPEKAKAFDTKRRENVLRTANALKDYITFDDIKNDADSMQRHNIDVYEENAPDYFFQGITTEQGEPLFGVYNFQLSNAVALLNIEIKQILKDEHAIRGAQFIRRRLIEKMLEIPKWKHEIDNYFENELMPLEKRGPLNYSDDPKDMKNVYYRIANEFCTQDRYQSRNNPRVLKKDGSTRAASSFTSYHGHEGGERIQANIMPSGSSEGEMKDFEKRGVEIDAPIHGHPETPYLPKRKTSEDIAPSLGNRESELEKARQEGDVIAQDRLSKNPFSNPEREKVETPKKKHIKPKPKKSPTVKSKPASTKNKTETKKEEPKKKKKPVKESYQRFIRIIPF